MSKEHANEIGTYEFKETSLLEKALCHPSYCTSHLFQRLEFMGDSVLNIVISDALMDMFPHEGEGALSKRRAVLVSCDICNEIGKALCLEKRIKVGQNVDMSNSSIIADAVEAIIGAIYYDCDRDLRTCRKWILMHWQHFIINSRDSKKPPIDAKTKLQEWTQSRRMPAPVYREVDRHGPDHNLTIIVSVEIPGFMEFATTTGEGRTKKAAEKQAAARLMETIETSSE